MLDGGDMHRSSLADLVIRTLTRTPQGRRVAIATVAIALGTATGVNNCRSSRPVRGAATSCSGVRVPWTPARPIERDYTFIDSDPERLEDVRAELEVDGYAFSSLCERDCGFGVDAALTMVRTDEFTLEQFRDRESELCAFSEQHGLRTFWVMVPTDPSERTARVSATGRPLTRRPPLPRHHR
jgi:hypothetical protein